MKIIKTNKKLLDFFGKTLKDPDDVDLTIGNVIGNILSGVTSNRTLGWVLGKKFVQDKQVELKAEDIVFLKKEISENTTWTAIVVGQILEILDN